MAVHIRCLQEQRTGCFLLDIGLLDGRVVVVMRRVERVPYRQIGVRDNHSIILRKTGQRHIIDSSGSVDVRAGMNTKIETDELTAEGETQTLRVRVQQVPGITESETAVTGIESQIGTGVRPVIQRHRDQVRIFRERIGSRSDTRVDS